MSERQCVDCKEMVDISDLTEEIAELRAEIERLNKEVLAENTRNALMRGVVQSCKAREEEFQREISKLREAKRFAEECRDEWIREKDAEIERLRGVEMKLQGTLKNQVMINDELRSRLDAAVEAIEEMRYLELPGWVNAGMGAIVAKLRGES